MRKSISGLMAAMTFALAVPFCVNAQSATKIGAARDVNPGRDITTRVQQDKRAGSIVLNTRAAALERQTKLTKIGAPVRPVSSDSRLGIAASPMYAAASAPLYGSVIYSSDSNAETGIYEIPTDGSTVLTPVKVGDDFLEANGGGYGFDGKYYSSNFMNFWGYLFVYHTIWDTETWEMVDEVFAESLTTLASAVAYDAVTGCAYGCFYTEDGSGFFFGTQDPDTFETTFISSLGDDNWNACAVAADGTVYAINSAGFLIKVDKATGAITTIGDTGITPYYTSAGIIDQKTGVMYWTASPADDNSYIFTVNLTTGAATLVAQPENDEQIVGLYMPTASADNAPNAVELLNVVFNEGQLEGYLTFDMPSTNFDGSDPANLPWTYHVLVNGEEVKAAEALPAQAVAVNLEMAAAGNYQIVVYVTDANGVAGPKTKYNLFVGYDIPEATEGVELTYAGGKLNLTWDAVDAGVSGGYIGTITYDVTLYVDGVATTTKTGLTATSLQEAVTAPTDHVATYYYTVTAVNDGIAGEAKASNTVALGCLVPEFTETFPTAASIAAYTIIDANNDGRTWSWSSIDDGIVRCQYSSSNEMDDWFISPAVKLEAGNIYTYTLKANAYSSYYPERFEVYYGTEATAAGMTTELIAPEEPETYGSDFTEYTATVRVEADGLYYFGVHGISDADEFYLQVESWGVSAPINANVPAAVTDVDYMPGNEQLGENSVQFQFTTPVLSAGGEYLVETADMPADATVVEDGGLTKVEIYRDGQIINVYDDPVEGDQLLFTDVVDEAGYYEYTIVAYNQYGAGLPYVISAFVGINYPGQPQNCVVVESLTKDGEVTVSFDAVTTDIDGHLMNADITYVVVDYNGDIVAYGDKTSYTFQAVPEGEQDFVYYWVRGYTERGYGEPNHTNMIAAGTPFEMPVIESFTDGGLSYPLALMDESNEDMVVDIYDDEYFSDMQSADGDNGFLVVKGAAIGDFATFCTGKIKISGTTPLFTFMYFGIAEDDENDVMISIICEGQEKPIGLVSQEGDGEWILTGCDLTEYVGKSIQFVFTCTINAYAYIMLDAIKVYEPLACDLEAADITAPAKVAPNTNFDVVVTVANEGLTETDAYTVELYLNDELVAAQDGTTIDFTETAQFTFTQQLGVLAAEENIFKAVVVCAADENEENNVTVEYPVILVLPNYPTVENLKFEGTTPSVGVVSWTEPDLSAGGEKEAVTEDFEEYEGFAVTAGEWTLVDADGAQIGGIEGIDIPVDACAFFVMDASGNSFNDSFAAHSGDKYMSTMYNADGSKQSDWLISPALAEQAQTISFYAKSYTSNYGLETVSVYYSTTDKNISSFEKIYSQQVPAEWTEYTAELPADAKYFAIVCESQDVFMLFVDDVTYIPANAVAEELTITGYNVYKNGEFVEFTEETFLVDYNAAKDDEYAVTVVYAQGESAAETVTVYDPTTGVEDIATKATTITVNNRAIEVAGAEGIVNVYTIDGRAICTEAAAARNTISVVPGVYVVKAGTTVKTVVVR